MEISLNGSDWKFKHFWPAVGRWGGWKADPADWPNAEVPGCAQRDMLRAGLIADPYVDFKSRDAEWVSNKEWVYVKDFCAPKVAKGKRVRLRFEGVDYFADYYFNGERLGESGNLFIPVEFDVTDKIKFDESNRLVVVLHPAPPEQAQMGWTSKVWTMKPRFAYQWDFATSLVPVGIWQDVKLLVNDDSRLTDFWVRAIPSDDFKKGLARVEVEIESTSEAKAEVEVELSFRGKQVGAAKRLLELEPGSNTVRFNIRVADVQLWWPNGLGEQNLYDGKVTLKDASGKVIDSQAVTFGFKRVRLIANEGVPEDSKPFTLEVNGRRTFVKGWNWVPVDHMYGGVPDAKYERLLTLARDANCNLIRIWGGGLIEKEVFYRACDKLGLMVWQEFTLSSSAHESLPSTKPEYVNMLREAAKKIVPLRRNHASHSVWCGGNELTWKGKEDAAMSAMHKVCASLDPDKPYVPTSPLRIEEEGHTLYCDYHGNWTYDGVEGHYKKYDDLKAIFHSEFGSEGATNLESIPRFIKDAELWPPGKSNDLWTHHGEWWIDYNKLAVIFGDISDLPTFVRLSQFIQWEGLRYIIEAGRRRKFACGGTIPWQFNEPWPNLSCTNVVDWFTTPKMAYYAVAKAYEPVHASAKYEKLAWKAGETFKADIWVNNSLGAMQGPTVHVDVIDIAGKTLAEAELGIDLRENSAREAGAIEFEIPAGFEGVFILLAGVRDSAGNVLSENVYVFGAAPEKPLSPMQQLPRTHIKVSSTGDAANRTVKVANKGNACAVFVRLRPCELDADVYFSDNYLVIPPGEERTVTVRGEGELICEGWNTDSEEIS